MGARTTALWSTVKKFGLAIAPAVCYALLTIAFDQIVLEHLLHVENANLSILARVYGLFHDASFVPHEPTRTVVLELGSDPHQARASTNLCEYRGRVAEALERANLLGPAGVVVDIQFQRNVACPVEDERLRRAGQTLLATKPVFFGTTRNAEKNGITPVIFPCANPTHNDLYGDYCQGSRTGGVALMEMPMDRRKIALAYEMCNNGACRAYTTLAYSAALSDQPDLRESPAIKMALNKGSELYHLDLPWESWKPGERFFTWDSFTKEPISGPNHIANQWLFVGSREDVIDIPATEDAIPGYFHQVSAVEAILHRRALKPISEEYEFGAAFVFWLMVEILGGRLEKRWHRWRPIGGWVRILSRLGMAVFGVVVLIGVALVALFVGGYYGDFALISTVGIVMVLMETFNYSLDNLRELVEERSE